LARAQTRRTALEGEAVERGEFESTITAMIELTLGRARERTQFPRCPLLSIVHARADMGTRQSLEKIVFDGNTLIA
jgi:hypothetical protein